MLSEYAPYILSAISGLLGGGLIIGLLKLRPESDNLAVNASERAVNSLISAMNDMDERLATAAEREIELQQALTKHGKEILDLRKELRIRKTELVTLQLERDAWKQRALDLGWEEKE